VNKSWKKFFTRFFPLGIPAHPSFDKLPSTGSGQTEEYRTNRVAPVHPEREAVEGRQASFDKLPSTGSGQTDEYRTNRVAPVHPERGAVEGRQASFDKLRANG